MTMKRSMLGALALGVVVAAVQLWTRAPAPREDSPAVTAPVPRAAPAAEPSIVAPPRAPDAPADPARAPPSPAETDAARETEPRSDDAREHAAAAGASRRFVFDCGNGVIFAVRTVPGEATLSSPQALGAEVITLPQVNAAFGTRYESRDGSFGIRGGLATFEIRGRTFADCTSSPGAARTAEALRRAAAFRARGHAPSWVLEISADRIDLALDLEPETRRFDFPYRPPAVSGARTTYRTFSGTQELLVVVDRAPCNDIMSGEAFASMVTITFENRTLYGCGQEP